MSAESDAVKRDLRLRIARSRRRVDRRVRRVECEARRLASWRTYVRRFPGRTAAAALGLGLAASAGLRRAPWGRMLGTFLFRHSFGRVIDTLIQEAARVWRDATPSRPPRRANAASVDSSPRPSQDGSETP